MEIKSNNEDQKNYLQGRKVVIDTALELYNKLLNIYKTHYDKLTKGKKQRMKVQNVPENLTIDLYLDEDNLTAILALKDDEVKLEPEETIAERVKLNLRKKNMKEQD